MNIKSLALATCMAMMCAQITWAEPVVAASAAVKDGNKSVAAQKIVAAQLGFTQAAFGKLPSGEETTLYTLTNANGLVVKATNFGGIITEIQTPDKKGHLNNIVFGFDAVEGYLKHKFYFGALIGRYGNRIAKGKFTIEGKTYQLELNNGVNHLHGGVKGFHEIVWNSKPFKTANSVGVTLTHLSPDGDQGYPGNLQVTVVYELTNSNEFTMKYTATTDKATPVNMTQHPYFNLAGGGDILGHELMINANRYTPVDSTLIPSGELATVVGTPFDFTTSHAIGKMIAQENVQLKYGGGYDHNFVLNKKTDKEWGMDARLTEASSGRILEVYSQEPGIQFYSGNFLDGTATGKGVTIPFRGAVCLEPQHFPDSPNQPKFPSTILKPGETYSTKIGYKFLTQ
jgi:aldose 1-epimerase